MPFSPRPTSSRPPPRIGTRCAWCTRRGTQTRCAREPCRETHNGGSDFPGRRRWWNDRGEGFCVFNDVAVATRVLTREGLVQRVAVIDCDVHQGNGTASIFRDDPSVFTFSTHGRNNYPFRKETSDFDLEWPDGTGDGEYLSALEAHVPDVLARHRPDLVFYLAGADPYEHDRWGRLKLTIDGLRRRDAIVFDACRIGGLPVVVTMAGGYARDVEAIVTIHANTIRIAATSAV